MSKGIYKGIARPRIRKGDTVRVLSGKDRGKKGSVTSVFPERGRVVVDGVAMVMKHIRPSRTGEKGQRVTVASSIDLSNVQLVCPSCKKGVRIGIDRDGGVRQRICKKCEAVLD